MWNTVRTAPFDRALELAVIDDGGTHALVFPCRRVLGGWVRGDTGLRLPISPTHWREWREDLNRGDSAA